MAHYLLTLRNGDQRKVDILTSPVYQVQFKGDASTYYRTHKEILEQIERIDGFFMEGKKTPFFLCEAHCGYMEDEGSMFAIYKNLRNPIVKLEKVGE